MQTSLMQPPMIQTTQRKTKPNKEEKKTHLHQYENYSNEWAKKRRKLHKFF